MSQSGRLTLNTPVPGAGIQTVTGDAGGAVPGNGAANIDIIGSGTITTVGTPGTNTVTIVPGGSSQSSFFAMLEDGDTGLITGMAVNPTVYLGAAGGLTFIDAGLPYLFNIGGDLALGDGAGTPAIYTAPADGKYFFKIQVALYSANPILNSNPTIVPNNGNASYEDCPSYSGGFLGFAGQYWAQASHSVFMDLVAGNTVRFGIAVASASVVPTVGITSISIVSSDVAYYAGKTIISGFKVA